MQKRSVGYGELGFIMCSARREKYNIRANQNVSRQFRNVYYRNRARSIREQFEPREFRNAIRTFGCNGRVVLADDVFLVQPFGQIGLRAVRAVENPRNGRVAVHTH